jgi:hypothetical protein
MALLRPSPFFAKGLGKPNYSSSSALTSKPSRAAWSAVDVNLRSSSHWSEVGGVVDGFARVDLEVWRAAADEAPILQGFERDAPMYAAASDAAKRRRSGFELSHSPVSI